jgi:thiol-disulfide isomerase/thioredoxin
LSAASFSQTPRKAAELRVDPVNHRQLKERVGAERGNVVLVNIWATWCKWCKEEMPALVKLRETYRSKGFRLLLVSADEREIADTAVRPTLWRLRVRFPTYLIADSSDEAFMNGIDPQWNGALPASFLYGRDGTLRKTITGDRTYRDFEREVAKLLAE